MSIVAGVDFGTLSVRVSLVDSGRGRLGSGVAEYPLHRTKSDPGSRHAEPPGPHGRAGGGHAPGARRRRRGRARRCRRSRSTPPGRAWCRSARGSCRSTTTTCGAITGRGARRRRSRRSRTRSRPRGDPLVRRRLLERVGLLEAAALAAAQPGEAGERFVTALEHCDMVAAVLCGITDPAAVPRSVCAMGHKWMWNRPLGGLPPEEFLAAVDPVLAGVRDEAGGRYATSDAIAGHLTPEWAATLGLRAGHPDPGRRVRRALGRDRRRRPPGRRRQRHRHVHLHHRRQRRDGLHPGPVRRRARIGPPGADRDRGRAVGDGRHLRRDRAPRGDDGGGAVRGAREVPGRRDRTAAPDVGQRRPHRAGQPGARRRDARVEPDAHRAGRSVRGDRGHGVPHADHPRADGGARRADPPRHQRRRHSAEEPDAEPRLRERPRTSRSWCRRAR